MALIQEYAGRAFYAPDYMEGPHRLFIAVPFLIEELPFRFDGLLDTGSEWCILRRDLAPRFVTAGDATEDEVILHTRFGPIHGVLLRLPVIFPADEGDAVTIEATWFISPDWPGPMVLGWKGCLERMRFALDPEDDSFYFIQIQR